jgi:hypothetical protein
MAQELKSSTVQQLIYGKAFFPAQRLAAQIVTETF